MIKYFRTGSLFIIGILCFVSLMNVAGNYAQHIIDSDYGASIVTSLTGAAFVTFLPIFAHIAIVGDKAAVKEYELHSEQGLLHFGLFWFVVTFFVTLLVRSDFLVSYYSYTTSLLAIWTFFIIASFITDLHKQKKMFKQFYDDQCSCDED